MCYSLLMPEHILQFFAHEHLPAHLAEVSRPFAKLAEQITQNLPRNPERAVALRKLLEAKDAAVRARLAKEPTATGGLDPDPPDPGAVLTPKRPGA